MTPSPAGMKTVLPHLAMALVAAAAVALPPAALADAPAPVATIIEVSGPVTWRSESEAAFRNAKGGELLFAGAVVRTGAKGNARLKWRNGGDFRLLPLSELAIPADEGVLVNAGKVWASFQEKLLAPFYFKSPSATAVVRGTILSVGLNPDESTSVEVLEGRVEVTSAHGGPSRMLEPGQSLIVSPFGVMGPIQPIDPGVRMFERQAPPVPQPGQRPEGGMRPEPPQRPDPGMRPDRGPDAGMRGPGPRAVEWLRNNRAAVRLEVMRQEERTRRDMRLQEAPHPRAPQWQGPRGPREPGMRMRPGDPTDRQPVAADPNYAFPAGRPPRPDALQPYCDPRFVPQPGVTPDCPPPPAGAQPLPPGGM